MNTLKKGLLERLKEGIFIGDGGYVFAMEKRGYVRAGPWTPEVVMEHPDAVRQIHREFLRAGSDVLQAFTFYSSDDKLKTNKKSETYSCKELCAKACQLAREEADKAGALMAGSISRNGAFSKDRDKTYIQASVKMQVDIFLENKTDFIICEFFDDSTEIQWTIEEAKKSGLPIVATMSIGELGDLKGVSLENCAVIMANAGADVVGVNCLYDPKMTLVAIRRMKSALKQEGLNPHLITQPNGFHTTGTGVLGYNECPEFPFAMESRSITRFEVNKYARQAYEEGVRYIGGCCGFEAYHIRAIAEELSPERGGYLPPASEKHEPWGAANLESIFKASRERSGRDYWEHLVPHTGRKTPPTYELPQESLEN